MASYNKVLLMGNLTRDVETRQAGSTTVAAFGIAVNRKFTTSSGERREEVDFFDCEAFGRVGETIAQYLHKGRPIFVEGRLKLDQWQDKDGGNRSKLKVVVESFQFIDSKDSTGGGGTGGGGGGKAHSPAPRGRDEAVDEDSIPFGWGR